MTSRSTEEVDCHVSRAPSTARSQHRLTLVLISIELRISVAFFTLLGLLGEVRAITTTIATCHTPAVQRALSTD